MVLVAASSSSSAQSLPKKYDVFISFRGEDTRSNFTSHLYHAFRTKHIRTYIDYQLPKGDEISPSLLRAIEDSYISVVVFSEKYASSRWCLDQLTHILHCKRVQGQIIVPVFYNVEPSHVRNQTGLYKQAFENYETGLKVAQRKMQMWKQALHEAANLAGHDSHTFRDEYELIQKIIKDILEKLNQKYPPAELKGLVGIDNNCTEIELLLRDVESIGIWGMGGIGKSTIARTIFFRHSSHYECSYFLENVREQSQNGLAELRRKFFFDLLNEDICLDTSTTFLESRLSRMKVFIVLDDISTEEQLEYLVGEPHCFGPGSKFLITTRDWHVLSKGVNVIYKVKELELNHSFKLFNLNAFNSDHPIMEYKELIERAVVYAKGIPLALKVLASYLRGRSKAEWKSALRKLEKSPHKEIQKVLRLSYDGLDHEEKKIFLDIACLLKGELIEFIKSLLDSFDFHGAIGVRTLRDKALINLDDGVHVRMHDLIQQMGLQIVREESIDEPESRSRLCHFEEIHNVLANNMGTNKVEGIKLDVSQIRDTHLKANIFKKMPNIRYLKFYVECYYGSSHVHLPEGLKFLPNKISYLEWYGFPLKSLPWPFRAEKLVKLSMRNSHLQKLWDGVQDFVSLQEIDLCYSEQLQELPNLSKCLNLKVVRLINCKSLCHVHSSIMSLHSLVWLNLSGCEKLLSVKSEFHLRSLQYIFVVRCWNLKEFSVSSDELTELHLDDARGIEILHSTVGRSSKLKMLTLCGSRLMGLPNQLSCLANLMILRLCNCEIIDGMKLHILFDGMLSLKEVTLDGCCNIIKLPSNTKYLLGLLSLSVKNCRRLRSLPELPPSVTSLDAKNCESLEIVSTCRPLSGGQKSFSFENCVQLNEQSLHNIMEAARFIICSASHKTLIVVPGRKVPKWIKYSAAESSVTVELPQILDVANFFFCFVINFYSEINPLVPLKCTCYLEGLEAANSRLEVGNSRHWLVGKLKSDHVFICNGIHNYVWKIREISRINQQLFTNIKLCFEFTANSKVVIKECGVCPVYFSERKNSIRQKKRVADICFEDRLRPTKQLKNSGVS